MGGERKRIDCEERIESYVASVVNHNPAHSPSGHEEPLGQTATGQDGNLEKTMKSKMMVTKDTVVVREAMGT